MEEQEQQQQQQQPSSPGTSPIQLEECIEPLLKFTLEESSSLAPARVVDLGLSTHFCSALLKDDDDDDDDPSSLCPSDLSEGVPIHPLYKYLASALCQSLSSGAFCRMTNKMTAIPEHSSFEQKEFQWSTLIVDRGSEIVKMLKTVDFEIHVQEPFFSQLKGGLKTVEGRCAVGDYQRIASGALILVNKCLLLQVEDVRHYASFYEMLEAEGLANVLPGVEVIEEGVQIYRKFYSEGKERSNGVLAIHITRHASQLYDHLASILVGLSYEGIERLMGLVHTVGTVPEALPPARSTLITSFLLPHNPNSSVLSGGARALAKHVNRSGERFWGSPVGSESNKNMHALDVISHLIAHCCWLNMHIVPPHGAVFEIRGPDGYGARWSVDGTKFIGFLEPYAEDGYAEGWKH